MFSLLRDIITLKLVRQKPFVKQKFHIFLATSVLSRVCFPTVYVAMNRQ